MPVELRPLTARSNTRLPSSGGTPGPSSCTSTTTDVPDGRTRRVTVPAPCISEFSIRVASTWATVPGVPTAAAPRRPSTWSTRPVPRSDGPHSSTCCLTTSSTSKATAVGLRGSRWVVSSRWTTSVSRSTCWRAMVASSLTVSGSSASAVISSSRMESAVSGVRSWCEASAASRRSAVSIRAIRSALTSSTSATRSSSGTP